MIKKIIYEFPLVSTYTEYVIIIDNENNSYYYDITSDTYGGSDIAIKLKYIVDDIIDYMNSDIIIYNKNFGPFIRYEIDPEDFSLWLKTKYQGR